MAQTRRRRRKKRRGTQGGRIDTRGRGPRPRTKEEARARARSRRSGASGKTKGARSRGTDRRDVAPTWRSAINRALFAAVIFLVALLLFFKRPASEAIPLAVFMMVLYIPMGYAIETLFHRRRMAARQRQRQQQSQKP